MESPAEMSGAEVGKVGCLLIGLRRQEFRRLSDLSMILQETSCFSPWIQPISHVLSDSTKFSGHSGTNSNVLGFQFPLVSFSLLSPRFPIADLHLHSTFCSLFFSPFILTSKFFLTYYTTFSCQLLFHCVFRKRDHVSTGCVYIFELDMSILQHWFRVSQHRNHSGVFFFPTVA